MSNPYFFARLRRLREIHKLEREIDRLITDSHRRDPSMPTVRQIEAQLREERRNGNQ